MGEEDSLSTVGTLIGPIIVAGLVAAVIIGCAVILTVNLLRKMNAETRADRALDRLHSQQYINLVQQARFQDNAICFMISELDRYPAASSILSKEAVNGLYDARQKMSAIEKGGNI